MKWDNEILMEEVTKLTAPKAPVGDMLVDAFFGFVGTYGSIAGCSAGVGGVFTGLGLFTSFAAIPVLGWGILGVALIAGILMGVDNACFTRDNHIHHELNQVIRKMRHQLIEIKQDHLIDTTFRKSFVDLGASETTSPTFQSEIAQIEKSIFSLLHRKRNNFKNEPADCCDLNQFKNAIELF
ncbi:MAG: hypothetical protein H0U75_03445 [Legionella sp.]|nr:hypothetical protein [Legionella sp.]